MVVNGKKVSLKQEMCLMQYLQYKKYSLDYIAVEKNGTIIPKSKYGTTLLHNDDVIEIVSFVGGG